VSEFCITGIGIITAIGNNVAENHHSLRAGKTGIAKVKYLNTVHRDFLTGEVKASDLELKQLAGLKAENVIDRTTLLGLIAANEALSNPAAKDWGSSRLRRTGVRYLMKIPPYETTTFCRRHRALAR